MPEREREIEYEDDIKGRANKCEGNKKKEKKRQTDEVKKQELEGVRWL